MREYRIEELFAFITQCEAQKLLELGCDRVVIHRVDVPLQYKNHITSVYFLSGLRELANLTMISTAVNFYSRPWGEDSLRGYDIKPFDPILDPGSNARIIIR